MNKGKFTKHVFTLTFSWNVSFSWKFNLKLEMKTLIKLSLFFFSFLWPKSSFRASWHPHNLVRLSRADFLQFAAATLVELRRKKSLISLQLVEIVFMWTNPTHYVRTGPVARCCRCAASDLMERGSAELILVSRLPVETQANPRPSVRHTFPIQEAQSQSLSRFSEEFCETPWLTCSCVFFLRWNMCCRCWRGASGSIMEACCPSSKKPLRSSFLKACSRYQGCSPGPDVSKTLNVFLTLSKVVKTAGI